MKILSLKSGTGDYLINVSNVLFFFTDENKNQIVRKASKTDWINAVNTWKGKIEEIDNEDFPSHLYVYCNHNINTLQPIP
jgi:hypothetical protein